MELDTRKNETRADMKQMDISIEVNTHSPPLTSDGVY
jgi:hypothetical protein